MITASFIHFSTFYAGKFLQRLSDSLFLTFHDCSLMLFASFTFVYAVDVLKFKELSPMFYYSIWIYPIMVRKCELYSFYFL